MVRRRLFFNHLAAIFPGAAVAAAPKIAFSAIDGAGPAGTLPIIVNGDALDHVAALQAAYPIVYNTVFLFRFHAAAKNSGAFSGSTLKL